MSEKFAATKTALAPVAVKSATPKSIFERFDQISQAIARRAFEMFESNGRVFGHELEDWFNAECEILHPVHLHVAESDEALTVEAEVPGFKTKDLEVSLEPFRISITGKKEADTEQKKGKTLYQERCCDEVFRVVELPVEIIPAKATAILKDGLLQLNLPKVAKALTTRIEVKAA
jgi:HSP20 family protein